MSAQISIVQLNIERGKHLDKIIPFIKEKNPDVICFQELREKDISIFEMATGLKCHFVPMVFYKGEGEEFIMGIGIFSKFPVKKVFSEYYYGNGKDFLLYTHDNVEVFHRVFLYCDIEKDGVIFRIGTTHFTWTPDGDVDDIQRRDLKKMFSILEKAGEIVFMGDLNAPRGREIFDEIAKKYKDNVPLKYNDSIDKNFHRRPDLKLMVDSLFSTPKYKVSDVEMICGLSDHCALVANISLNKSEK